MKNKQPTFNGRVLLPMDVIQAARAGNPFALERVLRYPYRRSPKQRRIWLYAASNLENSVR